MPLSYTIRIESESSYWLFDPEAMMYVRHPKDSDEPEPVPHAYTRVFVDPGHQALVVTQGSTLSVRAPLPGRLLQAAIEILNSQGPRDAASAR